MDLDPNDLRKLYEKVAGYIRVSVAQGDYEVGEKLPTVATLAEQYGVAKGTVESAVRLLRTEGLVATRQGAGIFVAGPRTDRPLDSFLTQAFRSPSVGVDYWGHDLTSFGSLFRDCLGKFRTGLFSRPSIKLRLLLSDPDTEWRIPGLRNRTDCPELRARYRNAIASESKRLDSDLDDLLDRNLIHESTFETRFSIDPVPFELYLLNDATAHFRFRVLKPRRFTIDGKGFNSIDFDIKNEGTFRHDVIDGPNPDPEQVEAAVQAFNAAWRFAREAPDFE